MTRQPLSAVTHGLSAACLVAMIDELDVGMLVCNADATLVHANAAGLQELRWASLLRLEPGSRVSAALTLQRSALTNAMVAALGGRRQLLLLKGVAERLPLAVLPLPVPSGGSPRVLLMLGRRSVAPGLVVEMLCRMHAVTTAEQRVLQGLLNGQQAEALAAEHGVKLSTVRSQITALRAKLGVSRVTEALRMVAELPPMAGALRHQARSGAAPASGP